MPNTHTSSYVGLENTSDFEPGDIAIFTYRDSDGEYTARELLVLAVDDDADLESDLVHGIDLSYVSKTELTYVAEEFSQIGGYYSDYEDALDAEDPRLVLNEIDDSGTEQWYETEYDPQRFEGNAYRTFRKDRMTGERIVTGYNPVT